MNTATRHFQGGWKPKTAFFSLITAILTFLPACERQKPPHPTPDQITQTPTEPPQLAQPATQAPQITQAASTHWPKPRSHDRLPERQRMVRTLALYGLDDPAILQAMELVPRHWFVNAPEQPYAYDDRPLPIGHGQTISQPFIVAYMTWLLELGPDSKVLEIGTGSGYQAAILNEFTPHVYTIEIVEPLGRQAQQRFDQHGYETVATRIGDGYQGWPEHAPFDAIIVTCAPDAIPNALIDQLKPTGRMVIPVGSQFTVQHLVLVTKNPDGTVAQQILMPVRFVPMVPDKNQ